MIKLLYTTLLGISITMSVYSQESPKQTNKEYNKEYNFNISIGPTLFLDYENYYTNTFGAGFRFSTIKNQFSCIEFLGGTEATPLRLADAARSFSSLNLLYGFKFREELNFSIAAGFTIGNAKEGYYNPSVKYGYIGIPVEIKFRESAHISFSIYRNFTNVGDDYTGAKIIFKILKITQVIKDEKTE